MTAPDTPSVVVAVDGSELSYRALDWAANEAVRRAVVLRVVHGIPAELPVGGLDESEL